MKCSEAPDSLLKKQLFLGPLINEKIEIRMAVKALTKRWNWTTGLDLFLAALSSPQGSWLRDTQARHWDRLALQSGERKLGAVTGVCRFL